MTESVETKSTRLSKTRDSQIFSGKTDFETFAIFYYLVRPEATILPLFFQKNDGVAVLYLFIYFIRSIQ